MTRTQSDPMLATRSESPHLGWCELVFSRAFFAPWLAMLVSTAGTFLLLLALSSDVMQRTQSATAAASVYGAQWLLPMLAPPLVAGLCARVRIGWALALSEAISAIVTVLVAAAILSGSFQLVLLLLVLRGLTESMTKSMRMVALKDAFEGVHLERASTIFGTSFYLGGALGGAIGSILVERLPLSVVALLDALTFAAAAALYLLFPSRPPATGAGRSTPTMQLLRDGAAAVWHHQLLFRSFVWVATTAIVFQGFHNAARTIIPMRNLGLGPSAVTQLQVISSVAILVGVALVARFMQGRFENTLASFLMIASTALAMLACTVVKSVPLVFGLYFVFICAFEVAFTKFNNALILHCPRKHMPAVASLNSALTSTGLLVFVLLTGVLADLYSATVAAAALALAAIALFMVGLLRIARSPSAQSLPTTPER